MSENNTDLKFTPLYQKHVEEGARMVPFSGWKMPVQYSGIIEEHLHTRSRAGLFDICHMGEFFLKGPSSEEDLERIVTCQISGSPEGKCHYGFMLNEKGGIVDDLIVYKISPEEYMLVVNAGTVDKDAEWIKANISGDTFFIDDSDNIAKLDLQGPTSGKVVTSLCGEEVVLSLKRFCFVKTVIDEVKVILSRTGYTGELGYELFFPVSQAERLWDMILSREGVKPVGLGARDTLRLEMGYSLYGSDIDEEHTPLEAGLERFIHMEKDFIGKDALIRQKKEALPRVLKGFVCEGRRSARSHFGVFFDGEEVGTVTSGAFSPCLKVGIGMCYLDPGHAVSGNHITLSDGRIEIGGRLTDVPFLNPRTGGLQDKAIAHKSKKEER
ncbi:MAG: glycine cleavage system aminomethyltransferase GcvT [Candidatus Omnitrophica bacterium]|nr:glycine cleavage system aminomethyltransferase GcvT [Candidatus Omnitrophota bacterium]